MAAPKPGTFDSVLARIRAESTGRDGATNKAELGRRFERVTKDFLSADNHYRNRFARVWLWMEWPGRDGADTGIDLVAEQHDGGLCAIQCKCYADDGSLDTKQVSKFLAKAAGLRTAHRMLVYTGESITANARRVLEQNRCQILTPDHFRDSGVDWSGFPKIAARRPKKLRPHQVAAVSDVMAGLGKHDRGQLIMACGTGKTLASLHIAERHCRAHGGGEGEEGRNRPVPRPVHIADPAEHARVVGQLQRTALLPGRLLRQEHGRGRLHNGAGIASIN